MTSRVTDLVARVSRITDFSSPTAAAAAAAGEGQPGSCPLGRFNKTSGQKRPKFRVHSTSAFCIW